MRIPKIIHQTWKTSELPTDLRLLSETWRAKHPNWSFKLWTDKMNEEFISKQFPDFLDQYRSYSNIQKVDAVRYLILFVYGGVFIDLDFECYRNIEPILHDCECFFGQEPVQHALLHNKSQIVSNAIMGCTSRNLFFKELYQGMNVKRPVYQDANTEVLESTGPFMLTKIYQKFKEKSKIMVFDSDFFFPLTKDELIILEKEPSNLLLNEKIKKAFALHYFFGTWWNPKST
ncbi:glycosyltransferase family 32 protein [Pedobacter sp. GR22-10]|uniref:glycosyltransferase family 32 protein n=1 Tax=Pedobacter sp. GR22-10 TaxID=2994472 RepID=UPI002245E255|nr:glycosyltransferase [Pedobacter sp. GR22-10]MCX2431618.1 glycosyltransferase [Pedobacter sp. GR22-10]